MIYHISDVRSLVEENPEICDMGTPVSNDTIDAAEEYLGVSFPVDYRDFLGTWGTLAIGPLEFYGITGKDFVSSSVPDAIWITKTKRKQLGLPHELVILFDNNGAEYYCLDTRDVTCSPVVIWDLQSKTVRAKKADSLFHFIIEESEDFC